MKKLFLFFTIMSVCHLVHARTMTEMITDSVGQQEDELAILLHVTIETLASKTVLYNLGTTSLAVLSMKTQFGKFISFIC